MDWETIQDALKAWLVGITGLPVVWENEPRPHLPRLFVIISTPTNITGLGQDYYEEVVSGDDIIPTVVGWRQFTVGVRVISRSQASTMVSRQHTERARLSLKFPSVLDALHTAGLAVVLAEPTQAFDVAWDDRFESVAAFNVTFAATATLADTDNPIGTIGTIELESDIDPGPNTSETIEIDP